MQPQKSDAPVETLGEIPLASLRPSPTNPRKHFDAREIADLAASIKAHGLLQRVIVRPIPDSSGNAPILTTDGRWHHVGYWEIVAGERRYRALLKLEWATVPVVVRQLDDSAVLQIQLIENLQRTDVSAIEFANGLKRLREQPGQGIPGMTLKQIAKAIGKSEAAVRGALLLVDDANPPELVKAIEVGLISPSVAELICRLPAEKRARATEMMVAPRDTGGDAVGVRRAKDMIERRFGPKEKQPAGLPRKESCPMCFACHRPMRIVPLDYPATEPPKVQASAARKTKPTKPPLPASSDAHAAWRVDGIEGHGIPANVESFLRVEGVESMGQLSDALDSGRFQTSMKAAVRERLVCAVERAREGNEGE